MQPDPHERVLAVFESFLRYSREVSGAGTNGARSPPAAREGSGRSVAPPPPGAADPAPDDDTTNPALRAPPGWDELTDGFGDVPTRESPMSEAMASSLAPLRDDVNMWDEPTRERLDVVNELRTRPSSEPPVARRDPLRDGFAPQPSIIVDEDAMLTVPEISGAPGAPGAPPVRGAAGSEPRAELFVGEMLVLIKYGHAEQVPRELDRWMRTYPDDLGAHVKIAEFWATRLDAGAGLDRLFGIASRALDRGDLPAARRVLERVRRDAPADLRVVALADRIGRG